MKKIGKFLILIILVGIIVLGKLYIDSKVVDYDLIRHSLNNYYLSSNTDDLKPIIEIMNKNSKDTKYIDKVQDYVSSEIDKWFEVIENKYICDTKNKNVCTTALEDNKYINNLLVNIDSYRTKDNNTIVSIAKYNSYMRRSNDAIKKIEAVIKSPTSVNSLNSDEIRLKRCSLALDCNCNGLTCNCIYTEENLNYSIICINKNYNS